MPPEKRKTGGATDKAPGRESANGVKKTSYSPNRWFHFVRNLRTFYDHFRIAFPQLEAIPKYYTDEWCSEFGVAARKFTKTENMEAVRNLLQGAGYGTKKWERVAGKPVEELARAIDALLEVAESTEAGPGLKEGDQEKEGVEEPKAEKSKGETAELAARESNGHESGNGELTAEVQRVREALGSERWNTLLEDPDSIIEAFDLHLGRTGESEETEDKEADRSKFLSQKIEELLEEVNSLKKSLEGSKKDVRDQQVQIEDKNRQIQTLGEQLKRAQATVDKEKQQKQGQARKVEAPSEMANKLGQYEETLKTNQATISRLESQAEKTGTELEELKDSLQRERKLRHQFEEELEGERRDLRDQFDKLKAVLSGAEEIPSLEEFEEMEPEELLEYIEDVEKEKQRAMAGLDALDTQEKSYQKQLEVQQQEMDVIQGDLESYKESNLATEMEEMKETMNKQRSQLGSLLGYSKNMKAQAEHLKERQEPMRKLVDRMNIQEKALIRYVRLNYDKNFSPHHAYAPK